MNEFLPYISQSLDEILFSLNYFLPELVLIVTFIAVIIVDLFIGKKYPALTSLLTIFGILLTTFLAYQQLSLIQQPLVLFHDMIILDRISIAFKLIFGLVSILFILFVKNNKPLNNHKKGVGDLYMILIAIQIGLHLMAMASNLVMIFIAIEMVSIGSYLMVGYISADQKQTEAAMKYVLFGSVCSAIMLYGMSLLYGFTGTLNIYAPEFTSNLLKIPAVGAGVAVIMVLVGIGFKLSFVPFQFWSPDVYEGAPTPVTAFLSTGPKIAGFAILLHFLSSFRDSSSSSNYEYLALNFSGLLILIAIITMVAGNFSAIWQDNVKRMLAYSSIGHTGFLLMALLSFSPATYSTVLFYLFIYAIMNMASFMLVDRIEEQSGAVNMSQYKGLGKQLKIEFFCFVIILLSLTGLPPTAGFVAKFLVFSSALDYYTVNSSVWVLLLMATGAITTVVSLFYYFKVPLNAYLREAEKTNLVYAPGFLTYLALFLTVLLLVFGVFPSLVTDFINEI